MPFDINNAPDGAINTGTATSATTVLGPYDTTNFLSSTLQFTGVWVGTITWEGSVDEVAPTNWTALSGVNMAGTVVTSTTTNTVVCVPLVTKWFRIRVSAYTSGTIVAASLFAVDPLVPVQNNSTVSIAPIATGTGSTPLRITTGTSGAIKATPGRTYGWNVQNTNAAARYLQLYNKATAGIPGTDTPYLTIPLTATSVSNYDTDIGFVHSTGISWAVTTDAAGTTAGASGDIVGSVYYA